MKALSGHEFARLVERRGAIAAYQRQPPHLRKVRQCRAAVDPDSWESPLKLGLLRHLAKLAEISDEEMG